MGNVKVKKKIFNIVLDVFAWLSFFLAVILSLAVLFSTFSGTENGRSVFGYKLLIVNTDSMSRSEMSENEKIYFSSGDLIIIKEVKNYSNISVGDVITFVSYNPDSQGETVSHKVRSIKTSKGALVGYETYGINTGVSDQALVDPSTVIGKYVCKIPHIGSLFSFFKQPAGFFTSILIPCLMLLIFFSIKVGKQIARREMGESFDMEIGALRDKLLQIEKEGIAVQEQDMKDKAAIEPEQDLLYGNKAMELSFKTLNNTIEMLTHTIESLANTAQKPVETLARTVEILSAASSRPVDTESGDEVEPQVCDEEPTEEKCEIEAVTVKEKLPFGENLFSLDSDIKNYFSEIHNELVSYKKIKYRVSNRGIFYRLGRKTVAKMTVQGKILKLYVALNGNEYLKTLFLREGSSGVKVYKDVLFTAEIRSRRGKNNAIRLIDQLADSNRLVKDEHFKGENVFRQIKLFK